MESERGKRVVFVVVAFFCVEHFSTIWPAWYAQARITINTQMLANTYLCLCTITYAHIKNHCILIGAQVTRNYLQRRLICLAGKLSTLNAFFFYFTLVVLFVLVYSFLPLIFGACRLLSAADTLARLFTALFLAQSNKLKRFLYSQLIDVGIVI